LNDCDFPENISVDIVTQVNSTSRNNSPLSLQLLEEGFNKIWQKISNLHRQISSTVGSKLNNVDNYHEIFKVKCKQM
jgi:hypothetical protein